MSNVPQSSQSKGLVFNERVKKISGLATVFIFITAALGITMLFYTKGHVIGWGLTLGLPTVIGFYVGVFSLLSHKQINNGETKLINLKLLAKRLFFIVAFITISILTLSFINEMLKGSPIERSFDIALSGLFCFTLGVVVFVPLIFFGASLALLMGRWILKTIDKSSSSKLVSVVILSLLIPPGFDFIENQLGFKDKVQTETLANQFTVNTSVNQFWNNFMFYEDTGEEAPFLFAIGFPKPIKTIGSRNKVGDITTCVYNKGYLIKKITKINNMSYKKLLQFSVLEQKNIEDRSIQLIGGSVNAVSISSKQTSVHYKTTYQPKLTPRWVWRPFEVATVNALHKHITQKVLERASLEQINIVKQNH